MVTFYNFMADFTWWTHNISRIIIERAERKCEIFAWIILAFFSFYSHFPFSISRFYRPMLSLGNHGARRVDY